MRAFVLAWLADAQKNGPTIDACNRAFHDAFYERFGGRIAPKLFGAQPVFKATSLLRAMWRAGLLERHRVGLSEMTQGFPKWVYCYTLPRKGSVVES